MGPATTERLTVRLRAWRRRDALVVALADGADPDASEELTVVARNLIGARTRRRLAAGVERVLRAATERTVPWSPIVRVNKREIAAARDELAALAERLRAARPVPVHAVAQAELLLCQGTSPLYGAESSRSVWDLARSALFALDDPIA
jgi:hypothetical protein